METLKSLGKGRRDCSLMNSDGGLDRRKMSLPSPLRGGANEKGQGFETGDLYHSFPLFPAQTTIISSPHMASCSQTVLQGIPVLIVLGVLRVGSRKLEGCLQTSKSLFLQNSGKLQVI